MHRTSIPASLIALWMIAACRAYDPPKATTSSPATCCDGGGLCVPKSLVPSGLVSQLAALSCGPDQLCVPNAWISNPSAKPDSCLAETELEGRCLPACLPAVSKQLDQLEMSSCAADARCVPCFDPISGEDTQACEIGGDTPAQSARIYPSCCSGTGRCVPPSTLARALSSDELEFLSHSDCGEDVCVPEPWLKGDAQALVCHVDGGGEGRCLSACLSSIAKQADMLARASCPEGQLCAPCFDPLTGEDTRACRIRADAPTEPPFKFGACCEDYGRCIPQAIVLRSIASEDAARLASLDCDPAQPSLCVPSGWLAEMPAPAAHCRTASMAEGRCLSTCLPEIARQAAKLERGECQASELCVPCFDPLSGADTEACRIRGDAPSEPARPFAQCCEQRGRCVPRATALQSISAADAAKLAALDCDPARPSLCVPSAWLTGELQPPAACRMPGGFEGRCLSTCLPDVMHEAAMLEKGTCQSGEVCVPCFDLASGRDTEACRIAGDAPHDPAPSFSMCCGQAGRCLSASSVTELAGSSAAAALGRDSCKDDQRCVPLAQLQNARTASASCRTPSDLEGRCLWRCLGAVSAAATRLKQTSCAADELCSPCFDPLDGTDTQACRAAGDSPHESARLFANCCDGAGRCVAPAELSALASGADLARLGSDSCAAGSGELCVDVQWLEQSSASAPACRALADREGRCLLQCLPALKSSSGLTQGTCAAQHLCVPCYDPLSGADTNACRIAADAPKEPARPFAACCSARGRCVPKSLVPAEQASQLPVDSCAEPNTLCAPNEALTTPPTAVSCSLASIGLSGRAVCIASCFLPSSLAGSAPRSSCMADERCVACSFLASDQPGCT